MSEELMEKRRIYAKEYAKKNPEKVKANNAAYQQTPEFKARRKAHYLRKKLEKQQEQGTLKQFIG